MHINDQRKLEEKTHVIWKAVRRDVIAAIALNGLLASGDVKVEISDQSLHNAEVYAGMSISAADALIAKLDTPTEGPPNG